MTKNVQIEALNRIGQSIWYDNLSREVLRSGELRKIIETGVSGLTSNPTIFKKAIADTSDYDSDMRTLAIRGLDTEAICEELMIGDVGAAADLLRPVFDKTRGDDGYASIEVSPYLAQSTAETVRTAERLWSRLARPNIMIKIPATAEGIPAIEETIAKGINVNVTLIFSVEAYSKVAEAYLRGLERRVAAGKPVSSLASVASFFVSRVDATCEKFFDGLVKSGKASESDRAKFFGKVGIANSKAAYQRFEEIFGSDRFGTLRAQGARVQRPLWASTGTKNPALSPVLYVEELAGKDTVNTVPPATLNALLSQGSIGPRLHQATADAGKVLDQVRALGIPLAKLIGDLQEEGVRLFAESYRDLLNSIERKRSAVSELPA